MTRGGATFRLIGTARVQLGPATAAEAEAPDHLRKPSVSGGDGPVLRLADAGDRWEVAGKVATPRLAHRRLPGIADGLQAVGGSSAGTPVATIESIPTGGEGRP